ncbi:hypothetical protein [Ruminococcus sp.]|uniref:hypothetical protein n=1 Tax=Ruminococcus sp. TaxID=41978 RepID=UPI00260149AC|nr:hypothetical protein [Ruminococcus sp.]MCR4639224.1 hypothetical protein [Ruminococcus sp.]
MTLVELQKFIEENIDKKFERPFSLEESTSEVGIDSLDLTLLEQSLCEKSGKTFVLEPDDSFETILSKVNG